ETGRTWCRRKPARTSLWLSSKRRKNCKLKIAIFNLQFFLPFSTLPLFGERKRTTLQNASAEAFGRLGFASGFLGMRMSVAAARAVRAVRAVAARRRPQLADHLGVARRLV